MIDANGYQGGPDDLTWMPRPGASHQIARAKRCSSDRSEEPEHWGMVKASRPQPGTSFTQIVQEAAGVEIDREDLSCGRDYQRYREPVPRNQHPALALNLLREATRARRFTQP